MKTTPCSNLPRPPDIIRAQCPEAKATADGMYAFTGFPYYVPFFSDYLWKLNNALFKYFSWTYTDLTSFDYPHLQWEDS